MRFLIITHVLHKPKNGQWFAYAPYVREMNLWLKHVGQVEIVAPKTNIPISEIDIAYKKNGIKFTAIPSIAFISIGAVFTSLLAIPVILLRLFKACKRADHIHLRCPGNIGLLGCLIQLFFPKKVKTAKYAGNWDPKAKQPISYKFQKKILSNTFFTKNITALVYGDWKNQTKNIKSFFTASYKNQDRVNLNKRDYTTILRFVFVGSLVSGKRPLFAIKIIESLKEKGISVNLDIYGEGILKEELLQYVFNKGLTDCIKLYGNQSSETVKEALKGAHFIILASKSEGWPKALAEAMFFGVIPISTSVSCVPNMLDYGKRGVLIEANINEAVLKIEFHLQSSMKLEEMSKLALNWSQQYTLDVFEREINKLLIP